MPVKQMKTPKEIKIPRQLPSFVNLKKLVLMVKRGATELWGMILLLQASPNLCRLELHLDESYFSESGGEKVLMKKPSVFGHPCLEEIMLTGFKDRPHEIEFVKLLLKNATGLKKVTFVQKCLRYNVKSGTLNGKSEQEMNALPSYKCKKKTLASCEHKKIKGVVSKWLGNIRRGRPGLKFSFA